MKHNHATTFVSIRGRSYTPDTVRPLVMRMLRKWAFLDHLNTTSKRSAFATAWLSDLSTMRSMNGSIPGALVREIEGYAMANQRPDQR